MAISYPGKSRCFRKPSFKREPAVHPHRRKPAHSHTPLADFKPTGYDDAVIKSYATFQQLQSTGTIPEGTRLQVSPPSPTTVVRMLVVTEHCANAEVLYGKRLLEALRRV